jgi:hypothetical protein
MGKAPESLTLIDGRQPWLSDSSTEGTWDANSRITPNMIDEATNPSVIQELTREADEIVCLLSPGDLYAIGVWYDHFPQRCDDDVRWILARATAAPAGVAGHDGGLDGEVERRRRTHRTP